MRVAFAIDLVDVLPNAQVLLRPRLAVIFELHASYRIHDRSSVIIFQASANFRFRFPGAARNHDVIGA